MGQLASIIKAFSCEAFAKYVFNSQHCASECCDCCKVTYDTDAIDLESEGTEISISIDNCCSVRQK